MIVSHTACDDPVIIFDHVDKNLQVMSEDA